MRLPEQKLYDWLRKKIGHAVMLERVENRVKRDTPDLYLSGRSGLLADRAALRGWIELKVLDAFPARAETRVHLDHWTNGQRYWALRHAASGGKTWLVVQVGDEVFVWDAAAAANSDYTQRDWRSGPVIKMRNADCMQVLDALANA